MKKENGITLVGLTITIIVLLILAGVTIAILTGDNGILIQAGSAKEETEIGREKEIIELSVAGVKLKENYNHIAKSELQEQLNSNAGEGKTELYDDGDGWVVYFIDTKRVYYVDNNNNIKEESLQILEKDETPGEFDGSGTQEEPYIIMSIEDLVQFSQNVYNNERYGGKYIELGRNLNFRSELSYYDSKTTKYNGYLGVDGDEIGLFEILTDKKYNGFVPIGEGSTWQKSFCGIFDGNNYSIENIYENRNGIYAGLFGYISGATINNLTISGEIQNSEGYAAGLIGRDSDVSSVRNVVNNVNVKGYKSAGGIVAVTSKGSSNISKCINNANIYSNDSNCGGISAQGAKVRDCINNGNVTGKMAGGICGDSGIIINCCNSDKATISSNMGQAGGISGFGDPIVYNSYNMGQVIGQSAGGILGYIYNTGKVYNCYTTGELKGSYVGGIVGSGMWNNTSGNVFENCYYLLSDTVNKASGGTVSVNANGVENINDSIIKNLNLYVETYNEDNKEAEDFYELKTWILNEKKGEVSFE